MRRHVLVVGATGVGGGAVAPATLWISGVESDHSVAPGERRGQDRAPGVDLFD